MCNWTYKEIRELNMLLNINKRRVCDVIRHFKQQGKSVSSIKDNIRKMRKYGVPDGPDNAQVHFKQNISWDKVREIRSRFVSGLYTLRELELIYGFDVRNIVYNKCYKE